MRHMIQWAHLMFGTIVRSCLRLLFGEIEAISTPLCESSPCPLCTCYFTRLAAQHDARLALPTAEVEISLTKRLHGNYRAFDPLTLRLSQKGPR